jgi:hypothetical protein
MLRPCDPAVCGSATEGFNPCPPTWLGTQLEQVLLHIGSAGNTGMDSLAA